MRRELFEAEKNYIKCAILMVLVGIGLIGLGEKNMGIGCIAIGITFGVAAVYMIKTNKKTPPKKEKPEAKKKTEDKTLEEDSEKDNIKE